MKLTINDLYDLSHSIAGDYLKKFTYPWEALEGIKDLILEIQKSLSLDEYDKIKEDVFIAKDAVIYPNNYIAGPCIIGHKTEVRPGAFIRGSALVGDNCVVGNSTELKNVILFDNVQVPHYNYVGRVLTAVAYDEPNEITIASMKEAMTGKGEELDLSKWDEFIASL